MGARAKGAQGGWDEKVMRGDGLWSISLFILLLQLSPAPCCVNAPTCLFSSSTSLASFPSASAAATTTTTCPGPPASSRLQLFSSTAGERRSERRREGKVLEEGTLSSRAVAWSRQCWDIPPPTPPPPPLLSPPPPPPSLSPPPPPQLSLELRRLSSSPSAPNCLFSPSLFPLRSLSRGRRWLGGVADVRFHQRTVGDTAS